MKIEQEEFEKVREKGEAFYATIGKVNCPYFGEPVFFNQKGLEHLIFKKLYKMRTMEDQYMRFKLLHLAPEVLRRSHTIQCLLETKKFEKIRVHNRTDLVLKPVTYYEFIAIIKRDRIKIIVKQVENGEKYFWSIIPFWKMNKSTMTRLLHDGDPEDD
jgi:hypothetical protein